jgi:hypothetical protein
LRRNVRLRCHGKSTRPSVSVETKLAAYLSAFLAFNDSITFVLTW